MTRLDKAALERALDIVLTGKDKARAEQVRDMVAQDGWQQAAEFCAHHLQMRTLKLPPWESPPSQVEADENGPAGRLLRKMLARGMSRFDPDPLRAEARETA